MALAPVILPEGHPDRAESDLLQALAVHGMDAVRGLVALDVVDNPAEAERFLVGLGLDPDEVAALVARIRAAACGVRGAIVHATREAYERLPEHAARPEVPRRRGPSDPPDPTAWQALAADAARRVRDAAYERVVRDGKRAGLLLADLTIAHEAAKAYDDLFAVDLHDLWGKRWGICGHCTMWFIRQRSTARYHNDRCRQAAHRKRKRARAVTT